MHVVQRRQRVQRSMYLPSERIVVNGEGLGDLEGFWKKLSFKPFKALRAFTKVTKKSFRPKNIAGAIGSGLMGTFTLGASTLISKKTGAHSGLARTVGYGAMAVAAVAGTVLTGGALMAAMAPAAGAVGVGVGTAAVASTWTVGGVLSAVGTGLSAVMTGAKMLFKGGKGGSGGMTQEEYNRQQQAIYDTQMNNPATYGAGIPVGSQLDPVTYPTMTNTPQGYGGSGYSPSTDMRVNSPYSPLADDSNLELDKTGRLVPIQQAGMIPDLSPTTWLVVGGVTLVGWYLMSESKSESNN